MSNTPLASGASSIVGDMLGATDGAQAQGNAASNAIQRGDERGSTLANTLKALHEALFRQRSEDFKTLVLGHMKESRSWQRDAS